MKTPDLWLLIKSLEGKEYTRVRKFLASPYFNSDEKHLKLFEAVAEQVKEASCDREALDAIIFPSAPFSYTRITNLISDLKRLLESFFVQEELKTQTFTREFLLMQAMKGRELPKFLEQSEERIKRQMEEDAFRTEEYFLQNFLTEDQAYQFSQIREEGGKVELVGQKIKSLHLFYVMAMLRSVCQDLNQRAQKGTNGQNAHRFFIQYILDNHKLYSREPLIRLYILILRTLVAPTEIEHFEAYVEELVVSEAQVSLQEFWTLFTYAQQYSLRTKGSHEVQVKKLLFRLYLVFIAGETDNWAIKEGFLSPQDGFLFLSLAVEFDKEKEAEKFISDYNVYKNASDTPQTLAFYRAYFLYKMKNNRKESLKIIKSHDFRKTTFAKYIPLLLTEIYYDSYEDRALEDLWEEVKVKMKKDKRFSAEERDRYEGLKKEYTEASETQTTSKYLKTYDI